MKPVGVRSRVVLPAMMLAILTLPGCMASHVSPLVLAGHAALPGCTDMSMRVPRGRWWRCLDDAPLSALIEHAPLAPAQATDIAGVYIALRAQQTALVLLAEREELDAKLLTIARQRFAERTALDRTVASSEAQLADTRAAQTQTRSDIAALRDRLAVLTGSAPGTLARLPGGPVPLPPPAPMLGDPTAMIAQRPDIRLARRKFAAAQCARAGRDAALADYRAALAVAMQDVATALARYGAAQVAAAHAQSAALDARAASLQTVPARTGALAPGDTLAAERRALDALQSEEQARAAMTLTYVVLVKSLGRDER